MSKVTIERAHRMDGTGEYYFSRRLREIAEIEATTGRQIIKLAMGSPDLPPHPSVVERLSKEALRPDVHKYMSFKGEPILPGSEEAQHVEPAEAAAEPAVEGAVQE